MPAIPYIAAGAEMLGGFQENQNSQMSQAQQYAMAKKQFELDKERLGWDKETAARNWNLTLQQMGISQESAANYEASMTPAETRESSIQTAGNILDPLYNDQMQRTLSDTNAGLMQRGFFGQAPGAELTNKNVAEVEKARNQAISGLANDIYQTSQDRNLQEKMFGISQFGQYGDVADIDTTPIDLATLNKPATPEPAATPEPGIWEKFLGTMPITNSLLNGGNLGNIFSGGISGGKKTGGGGAGNVLIGGTGNVPIGKFTSPFVGNVAAPKSNVVAPNSGVSKNVVAPTTPSIQRNMIAPTSQSLQSTGTDLATTLANMQNNQSKLKKGLML